jgi:programmed cell death protein 5
MQAQMQQAQQQAAQKAEMEEAKAAMLHSILAPDARERLSNIKLAKPARGEKLEMLIIQSMQAGKFTGKVSDAMLVDLVEQVTKQESEGLKVEIRHKECVDSDEEELDIDAMF